MTFIDLPVSGVAVEVFTGGVSREDLAVGDLLGGPGLSPHGADLAEVAEVTRGGVWLLSAFRPRPVLTSAEIRRAGRYITWDGLNALQKLSRLRMDRGVVTTPPLGRHYLTASGELLYTDTSGVWRTLSPDGSRETTGLPVGGEIYSIGVLARP
jgi:hypothetical protein